jgi:hypothetical protein
MKILLLFLFSFLSLLSFAQTPLELYGGKGHNIYLGCLNCNNVESNSIWNPVGTYGSQVSSLSIWNEVSEYGSQVSDYSPWNQLGNFPPVIVDKDGNFYGYLTLNEVHENRASFKLVVILYKYHDLIKNNLSDWYDKIFQ